MWSKLSDHSKHSDVIKSEETIIYIIITENNIAYGLECAYRIDILEDVSDLMRIYNK